MFISMLTKRKKNIKTGSTKVKEEMDELQLLKDKLLMLSCQLNTPIVEFIKSQATQSDKFFKMFNKLATFLLLLSNISAHYIVII